jgi:hypothetical protein
VATSGSTILVAATLGALVHAVKGPEGPAEPSLAPGHVCEIRIRLGSLRDVAVGRAAQAWRRPTPSHESAPMPQRPTAPAGDPMTTFLVERTLPGLTTADVRVAQRALVQACRRLAVQGRVATYVRSTFVPGWSRCLCLFEATDPDTVRRVNETAQFPFTRIEEAVELVAGGDPAADDP